MTVQEEYPGQAEDLMHAADVDAALGNLAAAVETALHGCYSASLHLHKLLHGDAWDSELAEGGDGRNASIELEAATRSLRHVQLVVQARLNLFDEDVEEQQLGKIQRIVDQAADDGAAPFDTVKAIEEVLAGRTPEPAAEASAEPEPLPEVEEPYIVGPVTPEAKALWGHIRVGSTAAVHWKGGGYIVGHVRAKHGNHLVVVDDQQCEYDLVAGEGDIDQVVEDFPPAEVSNVPAVQGGGEG